MAADAAGGFVFLVFFGLFCLHLHPSPLPPISSFQPSARLLSVDPVALPPGPCLPSLLRPDQDWGDCAAAPGPGLWAVGKILVFDQQVPVGAEVGGLPEYRLGARGCLLCAVPPSEMRTALWGSLPCLSSGSEWPGEGTVQPLPTQQRKSSEVQGQAGPSGAAGAEV